MSLTAFWVSADDMNVTSDMLETAFARGMNPDVPKPNVVSIPADTVRETAVLDLISEFQAKSDITLTHVAKGAELESFEFKGDPGPRYPTAF